MKKTNLRVVLNIAKLSVPQLIIRGKDVRTRIDANATVFVDANLITGPLMTAIDALSDAYDATANRGLSETKAMRDQHLLVLELMHDVAAYVEKIAGDDVDIVHLAGLDIKTYTKGPEPEFKVVQGDDTGSVTITVKARKGNYYKWQHCIDPSAIGSWIDAGSSSVRKYTISGLTKGIHWFRVVFIDGTGEHPQNAVSFAVN